MTPPRGTKRTPEAPPRPPAKPRRNPRGERNRQRLLEGAIAVLLGEGMSKFTSSHIAEAAGLHKPAFYAHFKNVDECLHAVALEVARANVRDMLVMHSKASQHPLPLDVREGMIEQMLLGVRQHDSIYRLLRQYSYSEGALGEAIRELNRFVLERWTEYFWRLAVHFGIDARHFKEIAQLAEYVVALSYISIGRMLDGHVTDVRAEATRVARYAYVLLDTEFRRMAKEPAPT